MSSADRARTSPVHTGFRSKTRLRGLCRTPSVRLRIPVRCQRPESWLKLSSNLEVMHTSRLDSFVHTNGLYLPVRATHREKGWTNENNLEGQRDRRSRLSTSAIGPKCLGSIIGGNGRPRVGVRHIGLGSVFSDVQSTDRLG